MATLVCSDVSLYTGPARFKTLALSLCWAVPARATAARFKSSREIRNHVFVEGKFLVHRHAVEVLRALFGGQVGTLADIEDSDLAQR